MLGGGWAWGPSVGAPRDLLPLLLPRMLRWEAATLGWESPGSPLRMGCPCATTDSAAGTGLGFQGRAQSSCLSSSLGWHLAPHRLPGIGVGLRGERSCPAAGRGMQDTLIGKRNYLHLHVPLIKAKPGSVCFFSQAGAQWGWVPTLAEGDMGARGEGGRIQPLRSTSMHSSRASPPRRCAGL